MNARRIALGIFSGNNILYFGVQKRLRAFLNPIFMERGSQPGTAAAALVSCGNSRAAGEAFIGKIDFHGKRRFPLEKKPVVRYTEYNESFKKE